MKKINDTTWKYIQNDDLRECLEIIIGDDKQPDFKPQIKLEKWGNECNASFRLIDDDKTEPVVKVENNKIKFIKNKKECHFYNIEPNEKLREGGYEFEVVLKEKPSTNKLEFTINTKGLKFYYQPPLTEEITEEQKAKGYTATETDIFNEKEGNISHRPENVVGSYAVYHESKAGDYSKMGGKNYRVGKAFHIYRPKITDANGSWTWGKLNIDEKKGTLTIEIDQNWLDNAVYPVKIDPTFGYTSEGESYDIYSGYNDLLGSVFTSPSDIDTVESLTMYVTERTVGSHSRGVIVLHSNLNIVSNGVGSAVENTGNPGWETSTFSTKPTLSPSTDYVLMTIGDGYIDPYYDTGDTDQGHIDTSNSFSSPSNPTDASHNNNKYSIYATYTAAEPETYTKVQTAKGRIKQVDISKTIQARANIKGEISKVLTTRGRIEQADITKTLTLKARIQTLGEEILSAKARVKTLETSQITSEARILKEVLKTLEAQTRIIKTQIKTAQAKSRLKVLNTKLASAKARLSQISEATSTAKARIIVDGMWSDVWDLTVSIGTFTKLLTAQARIKLEDITQLLTARADIKKTDIQKVLTSQARIKTTDIEKVLSSRADIKKTIDKLIQARGKIEKVGEKTISAKARIEVFGITKTIQALSRILRTEDKLLQAQARIQRLEERQLQSRGRIKQEGVEKTLTSKARIGLLAKTKTFSTRADILNFVEKLVQTQARIKIEAITKTLAARARLKFERTKQTQAKARIKRTGVSAGFGAMARILSIFKDLWNREAKPAYPTWANVSEPAYPTWANISEPAYPTWTNVSRPKY